MTIKIDSKQIASTISEMIEDLNSGFHSNETRVIGEDKGIQVQLTVTKDEDDFIEGGHGHALRTEIYSVNDLEI